VDVRLAEVRVAFRILLLRERRQRGDETERDNDGLEVHCNLPFVGVKHRGARALGRMPDRAIRHFRYSRNGGTAIAFRPTRGLAPIAYFIQPQARYS
jgi:hypothetical protein